MTPDMHDILCGLSAGRRIGDHDGARPRSAPARGDGGARLPGADHRCGEAQAGRLLGYVLLPDHVHLVVVPAAGQTLDS
ncbi:MAG: hypothetical protein R2851_22695 [Caldilineaceae bacterium]